MKKILIIGAGPAELTAAYELLKSGSGEAGFDVTVLEETAVFGGISRTVNHNGNRMDMGGHRFFSKVAEVNDWWERLLPMQGAPSKDDLLLGRTVPLAKGGANPEAEDAVMLMRHRVSRILFDSKFYDYPVSLKFATLKNMGLLNTVKVGFSYLHSVFHKLPETNLENFYINRFGRKLYEMFFEYYTENLWGRHPSEIDASWGAQRVKGLSISAVLKDIFGKIFVRKNRRVETSLIEEFKYPKLGPGQLWDITAEKVREMGGTIITGAKVVTLRRDSDGKITALEYEKDGVKREIAGNLVISSMPVRDLVAGMNGVPADIARIASGLPYRDYMTLGVLVKKLALRNKTALRTVGNIVPDCWVYVQDRNVKMGRFQIYNNWSPYMVADLEHTVWLGLEYFVNEGDEMWTMSEKDFAAFGVAEMVKLGLIEGAGDVLDTHLERVKKAYPAYFDTYAEMDILRDWLSAIPNLYCVGRNGQHRYNNIDHSMMTSFEAVRNITSGRTDKSNIWNVNTEKEYHEGKKTEKLMKENKILNTQKITAYAQSFKNSLKLSMNKIQVKHFLVVHTKEILLGCYVFAITFAASLSEMAFSKRGKFSILLYSCVVLLLAIIAIPKIKKLLENLSLRADCDGVPTGTKLTKIFVSFAVVSFCVLFVWFRAYAPGAFSPDSINQFKQVLDGNYNDWHPVWHTICAFFIPYKLTGSVSSIVIFQIINFAVLMGYLGTVVYQYTNLKFAVLAFALVQFSPYTLSLLMYPFKDVSFAITGAFCMTFSAQIYFTNGGWCKSKAHIVCFALMLASATLFRHNAILFTLPLLAALFFFMSKKQYITLCALTILIFAAIKGPVYSCFGVKKPDRRTLETMGIPLTVITYVAKDCPERLDSQTKAFVDELFKKNPDWKKQFSPNGFNSVKWRGKSDQSVVEKAGKKQLLLMMIRCFKNAPRQSIVSVCTLTRCVFGLEVQSRWGIGITENKLGIKYQGSKKLSKFADDYSRLFYASFLKYAASVGVMLLIMISFMLFRTNFACKADLKRLLLCLPIFAYDFGTMLLLTGHDHRFFFITFLVCPMVITVLAGKTRDGLVEE